MHALVRLCFRRPLAVRVVTALLVVLLVLVYVRLPVALLPDVGYPPSPYGPPTPACLPSGHMLVSVSLAINVEDPDAYLRREEEDTAEELEFAVPSISTRQPAGTRSPSSGATGRRRRSESSTPSDQMASSTRWPTGPSYRSGGTKWRSEADSQPLYSNHILNSQNDDSICAMLRRVCAFYGSLRHGVVAVICVALLGLVGGRPRTAWAQATLPDADTTYVQFEEAVRLALDQNTDVRRAQAEARQAGTQVRSEWLDFAPTLSVGSGFSRSFGRTFSEVEGEIITRSTDFLNVGLSSGVTLFNGFENTASLRQSRAQVRASELSLERTRREITFTVMEQFITLIENRQLVRVRREELQTRRRQLQEVQRMVDAGAKPTSDLYQEQANVAEAEQSLLQARREREVSKIELIKTLQLNPRQAYHFVAPGLRDDPSASSTKALPPLIEEALDERSDVQARAAEQRAAEQGIRVARASFYPAISISGSYGTDWSSRARPLPGREGTPGLVDQFDRNRSGSFGLSVSIPLFSGWQRKTQVQQAQVGAQKAQYALEDLRQEVALQVRQAYLDYENAVQQLEVANRRLKAARQARASIQKQYNLGSATIVELQKANRDYVEAASQEIRARYDLVLQRKKIDYHVGRLDPRYPLSEK